MAAQRAQQHVWHFLAMTGPGLLLQGPHASQPLETSADVLSNPLFDDPTLRLTPRLNAQQAGAAAPPVRPAAAAQAVRSQPLQSSAAGGTAGALVEGYPVAEALPLASFPVAAAATPALPAGPGGLSILYENQAMRMERAELKSELKLISARVYTGSCHAQPLPPC